MSSIIKVPFVAILLLVTVIAAAQSKITKTFHPNGKIESITYPNANNAIRVKLYDTNGKIKKEINLKNNKLFGWQIDYDNAGKRNKELFVLAVDQISYNLVFDTIGNDDKWVDVISGKEIMYFANGNKKSEGYIISSFKAGLWVYYNENGSIKESIFYKTLTKDNNQK
jgi:antitoxin component YwqK of YwqJK toxin-antitoxin module